MRRIVCAITLILLLASSASAAIDSAQKRKSIAGMGTLYAPGGVTPNASKPLFWRRSVDGLYGASALSRDTVHLSLASGVAFADLSTAGTLTPYLRYKLTIFDSAGKTLVGYIKAAGSAEALGSELVDTWTNHATYPFESFSVSGSDLTATNNSGGFGVAYKTLASAATNGALYKKVSTIGGLTGDAPSFSFGSSIACGSPSLTFLSETTSSGSLQTYRTAAAAYTNTCVANTGAHTSTWSLTGYSLKQVTAPSATGVTITSTKGGTTYNWLSEESGFNRNDANGYTYYLAPAPSHTYQLNLVGSAIGVAIGPPLALPVK